MRHRFHRGGRWQSEDWQTIEGAAGVLIGAAAEGRDLALAVIGADLALRTLTWRGYPERTAPAKWIAQGDLQSWLVSPQPKPEATPQIAEVA